jgi:hypothetical protein
MKPKIGAAAAAARFALRGSGGPGHTARVDPARLFHKARHRLLRELGAACAYARARVVDTEPDGEDLVAAWRALPPNADAGHCAADWIAAPPPPLASDLAGGEAAVAEADALLAGRATIFGEPCALDRPGLWGRDPLTGAEWPAGAHFTRFKVFHPSRDGATDIRRLWELGRFGWALPLARAWRATGREEYAAAWAGHARGFLAQNPPEFGPHWLNAMEVALRAAQWTRALALLASRPGFAGLGPLLVEVLPSLLAHGRHVRAHLEWTPYGRTNHFLADLAGLFVLAAFFPQFREAGEWRESSARALLHEMEVQTGADGFHAEASTAYHRFVLDLYRLVGEAAVAGRIALPAVFAERVARAARADAALRGSEDLDPRIGDDDSGSVGLSGPGGGGAVPCGSAALEASGLHVLRSGRLSCHVACGPNGQEGVGGHAHNDKLGVVLRADGRPVVVERGTWGYSADTAARDLFRSTGMHSTLAIDGLEQSRMRDWRMLRDEARARRVVWRDSDSETVFCGEHHGFRPLAARHRRTLQLDKQRHRLYAVDEVEAAGRHEVTLAFHLDPSMDRGSVRVRGNRVDVPGAWFLFEEGSTPEVVERAHSPVYGKRVAALALLLKAPMTDRWQAAWEFGVG